MFVRLPDDAWSGAGLLLRLRRNGERLHTVPVRHLGEHLRVLAMLLEGISHRPEVAIERGRPQTEQPSPFGSGDEPVTRMGWNENERVRSHLARLALCVEGVLPLQDVEPFRFSMSMRGVVKARLIDRLTEGPAFPCVLAGHLPPQLRSPKVDRFTLLSPDHANVPFGASHMSLP